MSVLCPVSEKLDVRLQYRFVTSTHQQQATSKKSTVRWLKEQKENTRRQSLLNK